MNRRQYQRVAVKLIAKLLDGVNSFSGTISILSRLGVLFNDFSQQPNRTGKKFWLTISAKSKDFKLQVEPIWGSGNTSQNSMGLAIINPPFDWTLFAMVCEPADEGIWGAPAH